MSARTGGRERRETKGEGWEEERREKSGIKKGLDCGAPQRKKFLPNWSSPSNQHPLHFAFRPTNRKADSLNFASPKQSTALQQIDKIHHFSLCCDDRYHVHYPVSDRDDRQTDGVAARFRHRHRKRKKSHAQDLHRQGSAEEKKEQRVDKQKGKFQPSSNYVSELKLSMKKPYSDDSALNVSVASEKSNAT